MGFQLADCFERVADAIPATSAVTERTATRTYAQLDRRANQVAHALRDLGVTSDDTVAVALPNCVEHLETLLGAWKIGAVPVNVNTRYTADEIRYVLHNADARVAIVDQRFARTMARAEPDVTTLVVGDEKSTYETELSRHPSVRPDATRAGSDRYVLYTGGTTGLPKGSVWRHDDIFFGALGGRDIDGHQLVHSLDELAADAAQDAGRERVYLASPLMHGTAQWMALRTLFRGGSIILDGSPSFDPMMMWKLVHEHAATALVITGDAFAQPLGEALAEGAVIPTALNVIYSGGARLTPSVARLIVDELDGSIVVDGYGSTEAGGLGLAIYVHGAPDPAGFRVGPEVAILDDAGTPVCVSDAVGRTGQVAYGGRLPQGYLGDTETTAARFTTAAGTRWFLTGDVARVEPDGTVALLGRLASSINTGGEKVFPEEVEAALLAHPTIADAIVYAIPDPRYGERVEAAVVLARGVQLPADVDAFLRARLAGYKIPHEIRVVDLIPRTAAGKPDREEARRASAP